MRTKLFTKNYKYRPDITGDRENTFNNYMATNDGFPDILEEEIEVDLNPE